MTDIRGSRRDGFRSSGQSKTAAPLSGDGGSVLLAFGLPGLAEVDADGGATVERLTHAVGGGAG
ncbi:MAG: hypothetical protein Q8M90_10150, partial [Brevundimonas sp.]|nr:hypothetical protein [Brevundimonas sp.]MDZ4062232.1 hypothetical protein [Brevundimonas sp.]